MANLLNSPDDTICAPATPPGFGGVSIIRVCGPRSLEITKNFFKFPTTIESHKSYFGDLFFQEASTTNNIDEVLVTYFEKGKSYTGDETVEISCHGSPVVVEEILQKLTQSGCRSAERGEFTFRAFMNGNLDLVQAESVLSLIESQTQRAHQAALRQLKGELSQQIKSIQEALQYSLAHLEANIDFSLENLETMDLSEITSRIENSQKTIEKLVQSYTQGKILSDSMKIVLVGEPNVGKSSLFNQLIQKDKAIVTSIAGTTRDVLESSVVFNGFKISFSDTAGIHDTKNEIEKIGIQKSKQELIEADFIFYVLDLSRDEKALDLNLVKDFKNKILFIGNKSDIQKISYEKDIQEFFNGSPYIEVSATDGKSLHKVWQLIDQKLKDTLIETSAVVLKQRQFELISLLQSNTEKTLQTLQQGLSTEFAAVELRSALENCYELLGEKFDDQILGRIFQEFCIGK